METDEIRHALQLIQNCIESEGKDYGQLKEAWNLLSEHIDKLEKFVSPSEDKTAPITKQEPEKSLPKPEFLRPPEFSDETNSNVLKPSNATPVIEQKEKTTLQGLILRIKQRAYLDTDEEIAIWIKEWAINEYSESKQLTPNDGWISVKERLPERNEPLIGYNDDNVQERMIENFQATVLAFDPEQGIFKARLNSWGWSEIGKSYSNGTVKPTHWMPLPKTPQQ